MTLRGLLFALLLSATSARADTLKTEVDVRKFADSVMAKVGEGDIGAAFAIMKPYTIVPATEFDAMTLNSKSARDQFGSRYGRSIGFEYVCERKVGESLLRLTYMEKTEKHVLPWYFYFYKGSNGWVLNSFLWNNRMSDLF